MLRVSDVAERFQVSRDTVLGWIRSGELPALNVAPAGCRKKHYRISPEAVTKFEAGRGVASPTSSQRPVLEFV